MRTIEFNVSEAGCQENPVFIGYQGENEVTRVIVDYSAWVEEFGPGTLSLEVMRAGDTAPYLAPLTVEDEQTVWVVSNVDTGARGEGAAGFVFTVGEQVKKSAVFRFFVGRDVGGTPGDRPDPYERLITYMEQLVAQTEENATNAAESASTADVQARTAEQHAQAAGRAQQAAETAQDAAETAQTAAEAAQDAAASSATDAAGSATAATQQAQAAATARSAAEAAQQAAEAAQTAAETAQAAAEAARDAASASATNAAGSATTATQQAQAAATARSAAEAAQQAAETAQEAAETAQTAAEAARDAAAASATNAAGSATTAMQQAQAAATARSAAEAAQQAAEAAQQAAETAQEAIEDMTVSAEEIETAGPTVEKQVDPQTGAVNLNFGFTKNQATTATTVGPVPLATFDASVADMPLKELLVNIEPVQEGSGDPSPANIRPIIGWTGCNIYRSGTDMNTPTTYPITFPAGAGTVYGGTLDAVNKKLTVTHVISENDETGAFLTNGESGTLNYNTVSNYAYFSILNAGVQHDSGICSMGKYRNIFSGGDGWYFTSSASYDRIDFRLSEIPQWGTGSTAAENVAIIKSYLAEQYTLGNKLQFVVKLAEPLVYDLTDIPEIITLLGTNNIWADCGDVTVTYGAYLEAVKAYAESYSDQAKDSILAAIAPLETTYTASRVYTLGSYLFVGTEFYKVTSSTGISVGDAITVGTNVEQTTVAAQLMEMSFAILQQPQDQVTEIGVDAVFTVEARGVKSYQWQVDSGNGFVNSSSVGNKTKSLTVPATAVRYGYKYRCKLTGINDSVIYTQDVKMIQPS